MQSYEAQFLFLLKTYCNNENLPDGYHFDVGRVFSLAAIHNLVPQIYKAALKSDESFLSVKQTVLASCGTQIMKNDAFEKLFERILNNGINALVVKGPVCAACYPDADMRLSSDFDIVVKECDRERLYSFLISEGFDEKNNIYVSDEKGLYLEVSTELGEGSDWLKNAADEAFEGFFDRAVSFGKFRTLEITEHLAYLLYHSFKHFVGSGFGLKQIADIYMYIKKYYNDFDYDRLFVLIEKLEIVNFSSNVFFAVEKIFGFDMSRFLIDADGKYIQYHSFVCDLLSAGVFGKSSEDRLHSATVVLNAVENSGKKSVVSSIFPSYRVMKSRFPVLVKFKFLLPLFWIYRLLEYAVRSLFGKKQVSPKKSIEIAKSRIDLMKNMGII